MNSQINDGGPAFPHSVRSFEMSQSKTSSFDGMALRDWFAGQALAGVVSRVDDRYFHGPTNDYAALELWRKGAALEDARYCYRMADAMLKAREA